MLHLSWAQEVPSSNLGAPTTYFFIFNSILHRVSAPGVQFQSLTLSSARRCSCGIACKQISRVISGDECPNRDCIVPCVFSDACSLLSSW
jgi:hypothetical protein